MKRILVIRGGAIGDFILTLPVLSALKHRFPAARIDVLGYPRIAALAVAGNLADEVHPIEAPSLACFFAPGSPLDSNWRAFFSAFDLIVSYAHDPEGVFQENILTCSGAPFLRGLHRPEERLNRHAADVLLKALRPLDITVDEAAPRLTLCSGELPPTYFREFVQRPTVAIHPGSGSTTKNWPHDCWKQFLRQLADETPWQLLLVGGEAEEERLEAIADALPDDRCLVAQHLPLVQLAYLLQRCRAFLGHDSGITHLAAALGLPGLALWGPSNAAVWRPRSRRMSLLHAGNKLQNLSVQEAWQKWCALALQLH